MLENGIAHDEAYVCSVVEMEVFVAVQSHFAERDVKAGIDRYPFVEGELDAGCPHKAESRSAVLGVQLLHARARHVG